MVQRSQERMLRSVWDLDKETHFCRKDIWARVTAYHHWRSLITVKDTNLPTWSFPFPRGPTATASDLVWVTYTAWSHCVIKCWTWKHIKEIGLVPFCIIAAVFKSGHETVAYWESVTRWNEVEISLNNIYTAYRSFCCVEERKRLFVNSSSLVQHGLPVLDR